jgi:hypothetical protein
MKRKQIELPDKVVQDITELAHEEERTFVGCVRAALAMWYFVKMYRRDGWQFYRERQGEKVEMNWI